MDLFGDALRMFEEIGDDGEVLETEARIAECLMLQGAVTQALAACDASLKRARAIGAYLRSSLCSTASRGGP